MNIMDDQQAVGRRDSLENMVFCLVFAGFFPIGTASRIAWQRVVLVRAPPFAILCTPGIRRVT
jgi:hypothetical protein